ncbi:uncharacterized protein LOC134182135 isoform X2 [Corticium candelabrum]|uniref:uncharacterized protein LOC134182135 isoform X2 n=1 Tax=Corticium candelabrum TaxID=121492 RepID=UPI002E27296A|nr:uncharacterized protein LOC134182135 isoform X2 [Corticium candelabrum]
MDSRQADCLSKTTIQSKEFGEEVHAEWSSVGTSQLTEEKATSENSQSNGGTARSPQKYKSLDYLWKKWIRPLFSDLVQILPVEPILDKLLSANQVTLEEFDKLKQMSGDVEQARYLLTNILRYQGDEAFHKFCDTLSEVGGYDQILHLIQPDKHPDPLKRDNKEIIAQLRHEAISRRLVSPGKSPQDKGKQKRKEVFPMELEKRNFPRACGRDAIITDLSRYFWKEDHENTENVEISDFRLMCICAQGGAGKSCVAANYARLYRKEYEGGVFFITSRTSASIRHSMQKYIVRLSCEKDDVVSQPLEGMNARFLDLVSQRGGNALLIYDSSDDLDVVQSLVPSCNMKVHVIITTRCRDHELMREGSVIQLPELDEDGAVECFCSWAEKCNDDGKMSELELDEIRRIVSDGQVKLLPLAIRRVATLTKKTGFTYKEMREKLSSKKEDVRYPSDDLQDVLRGHGLQHLQHKLKSLDITRIDQILAADVASLAISCDISTSDKEKLKNMQERLKVDRTAPMHWDLDLEEAAKRSEDAEKILGFASLMDTSAIPTDVLRAAVMRDGESRIGENEFEVSLHMLSDDFSLLSLNDEEQTCDIHALVQQSVVSHMKRRDKLLPYLIRLTKCMQDMLPKSYVAVKRNLNNSKLIALAPHVYIVCHHILKLKCIQQECLELLKFSCWLAYNLHDIPTTKHLAEEILKIRLRLGTRNIDDAYEMSWSLMDVGNAYKLMIRPEMGKPYFEEAVQVLQAFGDDSSLSMLYATALGRLAGCYLDMKNFKDAERLFRREINWIRERGLEDARMSAGMRSARLLYFYFLLI